MGFLIASILLFLSPILFADSLALADTTCSNDCSYLDQKQCSGNGYQTCGHYDNDICLEWSSVISCNLLNNGWLSSYRCGTNSVLQRLWSEKSCSSGICYSNEQWIDYQNCGADEWTNNYQCLSNLLQRQKQIRGCSPNACFTYTNWETAQDCSVLGKTCSNGQCYGNNNSCECSSGPCCDGCHYRSSSYTCNTQTNTLYGCPWGAGCGSDVGKQTKTQYKYCSGSNSSCNGSLSAWTSLSGWSVADTCSAGEVCVGGKSVCETAPTCLKPINNYIKYFSKQCSANSLFWFDSNGNSQSKYRDCNDNKTCTADSCATNNCVNELVCDGSTCAKGTGDYCEQCKSCGDNTCNCQETFSSCPSDCQELGAASVSSFAKWFWRLWPLWFSMALIGLMLLILKLLGFFEWRTQKHLDKMIKAKNNP